jgi:addiction module RelE/StbE family toxin
VKVTWSLRARRELRAERQSIAREQPAAAAHVSQRILAAVQRLQAYPSYGRVAAWNPRGRFRELPVAATPYVVVYAVDEANETIVIVRVVHGAQRRGLR